MIVTSGDRFEMIAALQGAGVESVVELGVYKGEFADYCSKTLNPSRHILIDFWDYKRYNFELDDAPQNREREQIFNAYFDGSPAETLREAYSDVLSRFSSRIGCEVIKEDIAAAADSFDDKSFDLIYLDGNHSYEYVLRDLYTWFPKLAPGGLFVCNDFFESPLAARQNIGVIPAYQTFSKRFKTFPVALSTREWSDFYFSNEPTSRFSTHLTRGLAAAGHKNIEVSDEVLGSYHHELIVSPSGQYLLPSFRQRKGDI